MRYLLLISAIVTCSPAAHAESRQKLNIENVIVFLNGAELTSTSSIRLSPGENEILFTNVAADVNDKSLSINATNGAAVESITFQNNYLGTEVLTPRAKELQDSIELLSAVREQEKEKITVLTEQISVLWENKKVSGRNSGLSVAELTKLLDLYSSRMEGYLSHKAKEETIAKKLDDRLAKLGKQLEEEQQKVTVPGGQLLVKFYSKEATTSDVTIDYIVRSAGWSPAYDVTVDNVTSPLKLFYKAGIHQNTGVSWNNVHLSLSAGNPNEGINAPNLNPWYLSFYSPYSALKLAGAAPALYNKALVDYDKPDAHVLARSEEASMNNYVAVDNAGVNTVFDIDIPYTVPCDGKPHQVAIKRFELPAVYRYYAVPKADKDAFLQAQVTNWEDLNLLPGTASIFFEGTYVGQGSIDVRNLQDTMNISLGRDKKIVIKRERDTKLRSVKTIGTNVREQSGYGITIRNTRKEKIDLVIVDQLPVSNDKDIVLEDVDTGGAELEPTTGALKWQLALGPNETRKLGFGFTVKYPRGKTVGGLR